MSPRPLHPDGVGTAKTKTTYTHATTHIYTLSIGTLPHPKPNVRKHTFIIR